MGSVLGPSLHLPGSGTVGQHPHWGKLTRWQPSALPPRRGAAACRTIRANRWGQIGLRGLPGLPARSEKGGAYQQMSGHRLAPPGTGTRHRMACLSRNRFPRCKHAADDDGDGKYASNPCRLLRSIRGHPESDPSPTHHAPPGHSGTTCHEITQSLIGPLCMPTPSLALRRDCTGAWKYPGDPDIVNYQYRQASVTPGGGA